MKYLPFFLLIIACVACNPSDEELSEKIVGDWEPVYDVNNFLPAPGFPYDITFFNSHDIDNHIPFYKYTSLEDERKGMKRKFVSFTSKWKIENAHLLIFDPIDSVWHSNKIIQLNDDTLEFIPEKELPNRKYIRKKSVTRPNFQFDKVIISTTGCFGSCPEATIMVSNAGEYRYWGGRYADMNGDYMSKINKPLFHFLTNKFRKKYVYRTTGGVDYIPKDTLKDSYDISHTDDRTIFTTFIKNDTIVKSIRDYGAAAPRPFRWGYSGIENIHNYLSLDKVSDTIPSLPSSERYYHFINKENIYSLSPSESFLLFEYIRKGKKVATKNIQKYQMVYGCYRYPTDCTNSIQTDGRFYVIPQNNGSNITIDIGLNFYDINLKNKLPFNHSFDWN